MPAKCQPSVLPHGKMAPIHTLQSGQCSPTDPSVRLEPGLVPQISSDTPTISIIICKLFGSVRQSTRYIILNYITADFSNDWSEGADQYSILFQNQKVSSSNPVTPELPCTICKKLRIKAPSNLRWLNQAPLSQTGCPEFLLICIVIIVIIQSILSFTYIP